MSFTITITESKPQTATEINNDQGRELYRQTVEELDLLALINTINRKKRKPRERKQKGLPL